MTPDVNALLDEVREEMERKLSENVSPESPETPEVGDNSHLAGKAGVQGAENISDANDAVDKFIADIVGQLVLQSGMDEDEAFDYVFDFFDDTTADGHLPPLPDDDADPEELSNWLGKATTYGVSAKILKQAREG
jgi:hypothetical protein